VILQSSGSIADNGALTVSTAFATTYTKCFQYFPADKIAVGVPAGLYYVVMSSTTVGTIYNNTYTSGVPTEPVSPTAFVTTGPGAYTQTTASDITLLNVTIPGGSLGINGKFFGYPEFVYSNSANTKTLKLMLNATAVITSTPTTTAYNPFRYLFSNRGSHSVNSDNGGLGFGASATSMSRRTIDTSVDVAYKCTGQLANAADYIVLETNIIQINPSN
jgi:hypothetical protein